MCPYAALQTTWHVLMQSAAWGLWTTLNATVLMNL